MSKHVKGSEAGFSLIELMIVVGLIGVLTTMAIPRFQAFQAKAKMGEAKSLLSHLHTLEQSYQLDNNSYIGWAGVYGRTAAGALNCTRPNEVRALGFKIEPCDGPVPRYGYSVVNADTSKFEARAQTGDGSQNLVCPGEAQQILAMDESKKLFARKGSLNGCD